MPIDYKNYPHNWHEISDRIRFERAGGKCEWCAAPHGEIIVRDPMDPAQFRIVRGMEIDAAVYDDERLTKVVLTTAHLGKPRWRCSEHGVIYLIETEKTTLYSLCLVCKHPCQEEPGDKSDLYDVREENLAALCQRCHLNFDLKERLEKRLLAKEERERADGQIFMEDA